jgi:hypothetical protein
MLWKNDIAVPCTVKSIRSLYLMHSQPADKQEGRCCKIVKLHV